MTGQPDLGLTLVLLTPLAAFAVALFASRWQALRRNRRPKRLTDEELRRIFPVTARRVGKFPTR